MECYFLIILFYCRAEARCRSHGFFPNLNWCSMVALDPQSSTYILAEIFLYTPSKLKRVKDIDRDGVFVRVSHDSFHPCIHLNASSSHSRHFFNPNLQNIYRKSLQLHHVSRIMQLLPLPLRLQDQRKPPETLQSRSLHHHKSHTQCILNYLKAIEAEGVYEFWNFDP